MDIETLKKRQAELKRNRLEVSRALKNASRRKARLKKRAKLLTDDDLLAVVQLRKCEQLTHKAGGAGSKSSTEAAGALAGAEPTASAVSDPRDVVSDDE